MFLHYFKRNNIFDAYFKRRFRGNFRFKMDIFSSHLYHLKSVRVKTLKINLIKLCENEISTDGHQSSASPGAGNVPDSGTIETD